MTSPAITATFPKKLQPLFYPKRYKVLYGGRGGTKTWGVARALLLLGAAQQERVLCAREYQNSIAESVHKVLSDQVVALGLPYIIEKASIRHPTTGTEFYFEGIHRNVARIKSYEGITKCWVEEANKVVKSSWEVLIPTIRRDGSEIIVTFNPELETDDTYVRFVKNVYGIPEEDLWVEKLTWADNPWFPEVLRREMESLRTVDIDAYLHVWEGNCRQVMDGAVYAKELRDLQLDGRICNVPWERASPVDTFWDLGRADHTSIWFAQYVGFQYRILDYYENHLLDLDHYLKVLQNRKYTYGTLWLPHDARAKTIGTKRSVEEQCREAGYKVRIVPRLSLADGINATRTIFPNCYFDESRTPQGLQCLRHYRYEVYEDKDHRLSSVPLHDQYSHGADAFRYLAVGIKEPKNENLGEVGRFVKATVGKWVPSLELESYGWMR